MYEISFLRRLRMNPDLLLGVITALSGFLLKTTLAFAVFLILNLLAGSPGRRFIVWSAFLFGAAGYWLWLIKIVLLSSPVPAHASGEVVRSAMPSAAFQMPPSWTFSLGIGLPAIGAVYLLILACLLVTHMQRLRRLRWIFGFTSQPPAEIETTFQTLAANLHIRRARLLVLSGVASPATFGWIRPTILLPEVCLEQDRSGLEDVLLHELHHVRRWDFLWNGLAVLSRALLFFHPAAWYAVRRMEFNRELACDLAAVADSPARRAEYAECLIRFARLIAVQDSRNWGIDFAAPPGQLKARVHSILKASKTPSPRLVWSRIACGFALLAALVFIEPSVGILLTYAHRQMAPPVVTDAATTQKETVARPKATRKTRPLTTVAADSPGNSIQASPALSEPIPDREPDLSVQNGAPHLLRRGSPNASGRAAQQTTIPINDPSEQTSKEKGVKQALDQTATAAAGVYRGLSALDRR
jgi:beta-lactamase regulating signal transducer with metallopeptidase domain